MSFNSTGLLEVLCLAAPRERNEPYGTLSNAPLLLPGAHAIRGPLMKIACSDNCLDPSAFHIVSNGIAHTDKGNGDAHFLQLFDETKKFISCTDVDEVDGSAIQQHAFDVWSRGQ